MAEGETNTCSNMNQVLLDDSLPLVDPGVLKDKRLMLVRDLDVETVLACMKPVLEKHFTNLNEIDAETNSGKKTGILIDFLQRFSVKDYGKFNTFLKIIAGTQPDLFHALVGREPSEKEADFCVQSYAGKLRGVIQARGHSIDSPLDEQIDFDSQHIPLAFIRDPPDPEDVEWLIWSQNNIPAEHRDESVPAVELLTVADNKEKPKQVSLHGRAGTGKTTTFQFLAREWSFSRWGPQFTLLFLLQLRMLSVSDHHVTAIELLTLAGLYKVTEAGLLKPVASWLQNNVRRMIVFIDGLDEVSGFATRLRNCPVISDLNQKAHPIDLCLNILKGNLLAGATVISASRTFDGLHALPFDRRFLILGLTESRVKEFVKQRHPSKAADIMAVLNGSPLLMSVCSITFYCALISRLLADGVIFQNEELETYTRLMAFLIVQCVQRKLPGWSFLIQVGSYFHKLAHLACGGIFQRQLKGEMSKLVFNDRDISKAALSPQDLESIQSAGLMHFQNIRVGLRSSVTAEFLHFSVQEMLASAYFLTHGPFSDDILGKLFSEGQFNNALLYLFGLQCDTGSEWIEDIKCSVSPSSHGLNPIAETQLDGFVQHLCEQFDKQKGFRSQLQVCQLLHEGQMADTAKTVAEQLFPDGKVRIENTQLTLIDLMAICFVCKHAGPINEITLPRCGLTDTLITFLTSSLLSHSKEHIRVLKLGGNKISPMGTKAIAKWLKDNHVLKTLNLHGNNLLDDGTSFIASALQTNVILQDLDIGRNQIGQNGAIALSKALETNTSLQRLDVSYNGIGESGAIAVFTALDENSTLRHLYVCGNHISEKGATVLATVIEGNTTLRLLDVHNNHIGDTGAAALAAALHTNTSLHTIHAANNSIRVNGAVALGAALQKNSTLHTLDISVNTIGVEGHAALESALQNRPSFCKVYKHL